MRRKRLLRIALVTATLAALPFAAQAQSYRCVGADGKKHYGQSVPPQCIGQVVEQVNAQGTVVKRIDPQASADERAKKEAEDAERKKREAQAKDQGRRDHALLSTYASEKDVESARARALEGNLKQVKELEDKIAALKKRRASPKEDAKGIDIELKVQEEQLAVRRKESEKINARYDEDKKRYAELTKKK
jgi:hypothetical protein